MATIGVGPLYGYANGNTQYGYFAVYFDYDSVTRSGTTITVNNARIRCVSGSSSGYTTNTLYINSCSVGGTGSGISGSFSGQTYHNGTWTSAYKTFNINGVGYTTSSLTVSWNGGRSGATSAQNGSGTLYIPTIAPPSYNSISSSNITSGSVLLSASINTNGIGITDGGWDVSTNNGSTWTYYGGNPTGATISGLIPGTLYWYRGYVATAAGSANSGWGYFRTPLDSVSVQNPLIQNLSKTTCELKLSSSSIYGTDRSVLDIYNDEKTETFGKCGVRYIRIGSNGSSSNTGNHIVECSVYANFKKGDIIGGIVVGGNYTGSFDANMNDVGPNDGEIMSRAGTFTHPNGNVYIQNADYEISTSLEGSALADSAFLIFMGSNDSRFSGRTIANNYGGLFIVGKYDGGQWYYNTNSGWATFTPNNNDAIIGSIYTALNMGGLSLTPLYNTDNKVQALISIGKPVTSNNTHNPSYPWSRITDGDTATANYADVGTQTTIDLQTEYPDISKVILWRYYSDYRTYYETYVKGYDANNNLKTVFHDYTINGTYRECPDGENFPAYTKVIDSLEPNKKYWVKYQLRSWRTENWSDAIWYPLITYPNKVEISSADAIGITADGTTLTSQPSDYLNVDKVYYKMLSSKNILNESMLSNNNNIDISTGQQLNSGSRTISTQFTEVIPGLTYTFTRPVVSGNMGARFYDASYNYLGAIVELGGNKTATFTVPSGALYFKFIDEANTLNSGYQLEYGNSSASYVPYSSVINYDYDDNTIGKNKCDGVFEQGSLEATYGYPIISTTRVRSINYNILKPSTQYTVNAAGVNSVVIREYDSNFKAISSSEWQSLPYTYISNSNAKYYKLIFKIDDSTIIDENNIFQVQFEDGSSTTTYEPYAVQSSYSRGVIGLLPLTKYFAVFFLNTARTGELSTPVVIEFTTEDIPNDFCRLIYSNGTVSEAKKLYAITDTNLFSSLKESYTSNGITVTNNGDGSYTFNGTATADTDLFISNSQANNSDISDAVQVKKEDIFTLNRQIISGTFNGNTNLILSLRKSDNTYIWDYMSAGDSGIKTKMTTQGYLAGFRVYAASGKTFNNWTIKPSLLGCILIPRYKISLIE